jgi:A/G-specific adenine glycosylase
VVRLPETDNPDDAWREAQRHATVEDVQALTPFVHVFSHYKLKIEPLLFDASTQRAQIADNPSSRWCTIDELAKVGLPAPVRSLLLTLP